MKEAAEKKLREEQQTQTGQSASAAAGTQTIEVGLRYLKRGERKVQGSSATSQTTETITETRRKFEEEERIRRETEVTVECTVSGR